MKTLALATGLLLLLTGCSGGPTVPSATAGSPSAGTSVSPPAPSGRQSPGTTTTGVATDLPGDRYVALAMALHRRGVAIWWETDLVAKWLEGPAAVDQAVTRLGELAKVPGTAGFKVSDEIGYGDGLTSMAQATDFLRQIRARLAKVAPGKQILVDAVVPELGCLPWRGGNQEGCAQRVRQKYPAASAAAIESYLRAGLIDRLDLSTGLLPDSTYVSWGIDRQTAQTDVWNRVKSQGWGSLTILQSRKALADAGGYQGSDVQAAADATTYVDIPVAAGAQAVDIWTWRQRYQGKVVSLLGPDLAGNALWTALVRRRHWVAEEKTMTSTNPVDRRRAAVGPARRVLDVLIGGLLLLLVTPLLAVVAVLVLVTSGRPVLFRQSRIGEHARPFALYKFRTMQLVASGPEVTATADARITRLGGFLRRTAIDELPQLWHVLRGQMTLVGPRPESATLAARYPTRCRQVLEARPGLTGPAQLRYRERSAVPPNGRTDVEDWYLDVLVPLRVAADREYLDRPTIRRTLYYVTVTGLFVVGLADLQQPVTAQTASSS